MHQVIDRPATGLHPVHPSPTAQLCMREGERERERERERVCARREGKVLGYVYKLATLPYLSLSFSLSLSVSLSLSLPPLSVSITYLPFKVDSGYRIVHEGACEAWDIEARIRLACGAAE